MEWAVLLSLKREGTPRFASAHRIQALANELSQLSPERPCMALHLCGNEARRALAGDGPPQDSGGIRTQINGFTAHVDAHLPLVPFGTWVRGYAGPVILQVQNERALSVARLLAEVHSNVVALWDQSGGRGRLTAWPDPLPGLRMGYAGGITPDNVKHAIEDLVSRSSDQEAWIDMESGVRTNDELDLDKVRSVLAQAEPYITRPA